MDALFTDVYFNGAYVSKSLFTNPEPMGDSYIIVYHSPTSDDPNNHHAVNGYYFSQDGYFLGMDHQINELQIINSNMIKAIYRF